MYGKLKKVPERAEGWPEADQVELLEIAEQIESRHNGSYAATAEELRAIDEGDQSGVATAVEVEEAFKAFRRAARRHCRA